MEFQIKPNVKIVCSLEIGDKVKTDGWGYQLDNKELTIQDIKLGHCESYVLIKVDGYARYIDSSWVKKI